MKKLLLITTLLPALLAGCSKDDSINFTGAENAPSSGIHYTNSSAGNFWDAIFANSLNSITVTNFDGQALKGAQILIGDAMNVPFSGNFLTANDQGMVEIPAGWVTTASITVAAPGYVRMTYMNQLPGPMTIKLHQASTKKYQLSGKVTGLPVTDFDGIADFSLVMPALTKSDLMSFDLNTVISSQSDSFSTLGQTFEVPSNISLPTQKERYSFFTATLDKPVYRSFIGQPGVVRMYALRGRFPFSDVVGDLRNGKTFFGVLNKMEITGGSIRDINVKTDETALDIPGMDLSFTDKRKGFASAINSDETFLAVGVAQQSGYMIPTDVKNLVSGEGADISLLPNSKPLFLAVIKKTADLSAATNPGADRMSAALVNFVPDVHPTLLPMIGNPKVTAIGDLILPQVSPINGVHALMTFTVLSQVFETVQGTNKIQNLNHLWEVYAPNWITQMNIPEWPNDPVIKGTKRWEVSFIGSQNTTQPGVGPAIIEAATHVTHSSLDF